jgi:hypothetical protein
VSQTRTRIQATHPVVERTHIRVPSEDARTPEIRLRLRRVRARVGESRGRAIATQARVSATYARDPEIRAGVSLAHTLVREDDERFTGGRGASNVSPPQSTATRNAARDSRLDPAAAENRAMR